MAATPVQEALENIRNADPARIGDIDAVILFDLSGDGGGQWTLKLASGSIELEEGETTSPSMTLSMDASDFVSMVNGELNAMAAFMQGKIKVSGDMSLAMKLQSMLS
jgi:putative sterol carrier protein